MNVYRHKSYGTYALKTPKHIGNPNISQYKLSLDTFACYFQAVDYPESVFYTPDEDVLYFTERYVKGEIQVIFSELDEPILLSEISMAINQLSNWKFAGPDRLINDFLSMESMFYYHI